MLVSDHPQQLPSGEYVNNPFPHLMCFLYSLLIIPIGCTLSEILHCSTISFASLSVAPCRIPQVMMKALQLSKNSPTSTSRSSFPLWCHSRVYLRMSISYSSSLPLFTFVRIRTDLLDTHKHGSKLKEWLPNRRFQLIYKATLYVYL